MGGGWRDVLTSVITDHFLGVETPIFDTNGACMFPCQFVPCPAADSVNEDNKQNEEGERDMEAEATDPGFEPNEYIGKYYDRAYGEMNVVNKDGTLYAIFNQGDSVFTLTHTTGDFFLFVSSTDEGASVGFVRISLFLFLSFLVPDSSLFFHLVSTLLSIYLLFLA